MKVIGVATLVVSISAILGCGPGVPTRESATANNTETKTAFEGNDNTIIPVTNVSDTALNPPHGQPGHRCDIPVGKPLNSNPSKTTPTTTPLTTIPSPTITPKTNAITVAPGMNPAHGQPGHRCDIPVGKPLNSKPSNTTPTASPFPTIPSPTVTPKANAIAVAPGMNPKHGQPGHRCDIPVGQPLNSNPSNTTPTATPFPTIPSQTITPKTNATTVAPGMNPAHGQPGHRCDIPVGKPLNSPVKVTKDSTGG
jgi:hypothetical protein